MLLSVNIVDALSSAYPVIDVRSPIEYNQGHIPNAVNIPLFSDEERTEIGIVYKNKSEKAAIELGLQIVNPKLNDFILKARQIAPELKVVVCCWRGGMRSNSFAKLLNENHFTEVKVIIGGYNSYRKHVREFIGQPITMKILGGYTGSGKTMILKELVKNGQQVIDLEDLANHKGSAFGGISQPAQPTNEHFENMLFYQLSKLDLSKEVWLEDESRNIGKVVIPDVFFEQMQKAGLYFIDIPKEERAKFLVIDYKSCDRDLIKQSVLKISKRLGGQNAVKTSKLIDENKLYEAALITLGYYDKAYFKMMQTREQSSIIKLDLPKVDHQKNAELLFAQYCKISNSC
ncbi:MAG TPA: tRNA 2-selenouridine(34) synthase MnmH [Bacteroidales bacterium]|nr:tRNA 2-selenouridine(34) synthase MnmH [Bacteroidales bacterium]